MNSAIASRSSPGWSTPEGWSALSAFRDRSSFPFVADDAVNSGCAASGASAGIPRSQRNVDGPLSLTSRARNFTGTRFIPVHSIARSTTSLIDSVSCCSSTPTRCIAKSHPARRSVIPPQPSRKNSSVALPLLVYRLSSRILRTRGKPPRHFPHQP